MNENDIKLIPTQWIDLDLIDLNEGQVEGLPANPRNIDPVDYEILKRSIIENPEMLGLKELYVYAWHGRFVDIDGNMRTRVLRELGYTKAPCKVIPETGYDLQAIAIKMNISNGKWDTDKLNADWEKDKLEGWGVELPEMTIEDEPNADELTADGEDKPYSIKFTFKNQTELNKFRDAYEKIIADEFDVNIALSGGKL